MIVDLDKLDEDPFIGKTYDVCICGAGVAGITLARKLSGRLRVLLLEAGGVKYTRESQDVYKGTSIGRSYFDLSTTRLRYFGGTSNHWTGVCRPLDEHDFRSWPIDRRDLTPYLDEARSILDIDSDAVGLSAGPLDAISNAENLRRVESWQSGPAPTNFGTKYRAEIEIRQNVECFLNANLVNLQLSEDLSTVHSGEVRNYAGRTFVVEAGNFVLAAGGIENPRILLNCNRQIPTGIGNQFDLVGRFFSEHPHHNAGHFLLEDVAKETIAKSWSKKGAARRDFSPTKEFMDKEGILNIQLEVQPYDPNEQRSFKDAIKGIICRSDLAVDMVKQIRGKEPNCSSAYDGQLLVISEQANNPLSRVTLGADLDMFGLKRVLLDWNLSKIDKRTIKHATIALGRAFADFELGRIQLAQWLLDDNGVPGLGVAEGYVAGHHHMCTTRMSSSAEEGVVDKNQRVFGTSNLYIAGSSVFSSGGQANPTFTIVQMTLRLADYFNGKIVA